MGVEENQGSGEHRPASHRSRGQHADRRTGVLIAPPGIQRLRAAVRARVATYRTRKVAWRVASPLIFVVGGVLFVTSAISSEGTDLRPERYSDLADLAGSRTDRVEDLMGEVAALEASIDELTDRVGSPELDELNLVLDQLRIANGRTEVTGPGLTVTLNDAPRRVLDDAEGDLSRKIVHQQDIQAVANAFFASGAEAITVQGQRIVSTTGIKCVGSSVLLQGIAYPPPYVISAIGDPARLGNGLLNDRQLQRYRDDVETYELGWEVEASESLTFPAYDGALDTTYAKPLG